MAGKNSAAQNTRSIRASKAKLTSALYASGMKTQTKLAEKIADNEGLPAIPKNLVSKVFTGKPVDPLSLERVTTALGVETHTVLMTSDESEDAIDSTSANLETEPSSPISVAPAESIRRPPATLLVATLAFLAGVVATYSFILVRGGLDASANSYTSVNFAFAEGDPLRGYGIFDGMLVGIDTMNIESVGYSIRDLLDTSTAKLSFTFDEPIEYFRLDVSYVLPPDEFLTGFSLGLPTQTTGNMVVVDGVVTSDVPGDSGAGALIWENLNTRDVYFEIQNTPDSEAMPALVIDTFGFRPRETQ